VAVAGPAVLLRQADLLAPARPEGRRLPIGPKNPRENNMAFLRASDMGFLAYQSASPSA